jgi:uncharacterized membrane protein YuzA (DUF378 family)
MKMSGMGMLAWILIVIGGLNWGLVGFFKFDLVATLFGGMDSMIARVVYGLVGLAALWSLISMFSKGGSGDSMGGQKSM